MPPRYDTYECLNRNRKPFERLRFIGIVVEWFLYYAFGRPRRGLEALEPSDVDEVELWDVQHKGTGVRHALATVKVAPTDASLSLKIAKHLISLLEKASFRILEALPGGSPRDGDHDLIVERLGCRGRCSMEVKLMQIGDSALQAARSRERTAALAMACWNNCTKGRQGFIGRFLCMLQIPPPMTGGSLEERVPKGKLKIDFYRVVQDGSWDWVSDYGWPALAAPVRDVSRSRSPAPSQVSGS